MALECYNDVNTGGTDTLDALVGRQRDSTGGLHIHNDEIYKNNIVFGSYRSMKE